jgi:transcriptional regulator with XRE-family HTH domain
MTLGQRIRDRRTDIGLTQDSLATKLGVTSQHISAIENDKRAPSLEFLLKLAKALNVTTDYLLSGEAAIVTPTISAIKADSKLSSRARNALAVLVEELYGRA